MEYHFQVKQLWYHYRRIMHNTRKKDYAMKHLRFFLLETLKNSILNEKFNPWITQIMAFFPNIGTLFSNFWKKARERSPPPPPPPFSSLVTRLFLPKMSYTDEYLYRGKIFTDWFIKCYDGHINFQLIYGINLSIFSSL